MSTSKPNIQQFLKEIQTIANDVLDCDMTVVLLNEKNAHPGRPRTVADDYGVTVIDPTVFHTDHSKIGVIIKEKWNEQMFLNLRDDQATVMLYWRTWFWYGNFEHIDQTLAPFFKEYKDMDTSSPLECCVCLEKSEELRLEYVFECNHQFCIVCVPKIAASTCPLCRARSLTKKFDIGTS